MTYQYRLEEPDAEKTEAIKNEKAEQERKKKEAYGAAKQEPPLKTPVQNT